LAADSAHVAIEVLEAEKRPVAAVADHDEVRAIRTFEIWMDHIDCDPMLVDPGHNLDERILREQFGYYGEPFWRGAPRGGNPSAVS